MPPPSPRHRPLTPLTAPAPDTAPPPHHTTPWHHTTPCDHQVKSQTNFLTAERRVEGEKLNKQLERAVEDRDKLLAERAGLVAELQAVQVPRPPI